MAAIVLRLTARNGLRVFAGANSGFEGVKQRGTAPRQRGRWSCRMGYSGRLSSAGQSCVDRKMASTCVRESMSEFQSDREAVLGAKSVPVSIRK